MLLGGYHPNEWARPISFVPGILLEINSISGVNFVNAKWNQKVFNSRAEYLIWNPESCF